MRTSTPTSGWWESEQGYSKQLLPIHHPIRRCEKSRLSAHACVLVPLASNLKSLRPHLAAAHRCIHTAHARAALPNHGIDAELQLGGVS